MYLLVSKCICLWFNFSMVTMLYCLLRQSQMVIKRNMNIKSVNILTDGQWL